MAQFDDLTEFKSKLDKSLPLSPETREMLDARVKIHWTYHSNAIDGNNLSLQVLMGMLFC
jgi:hypothetical protein